MKQPKQQITRYCIICNEETTFEYYATQIRNGRKVFDLYRCSICRDSMAENLSKEWKQHMKILEEKI